MKDSGIPWIGEIPEHWEVLPHKRVMHKVKIIQDKYNDEPILSLTMKGVIVRDLEAGGKMPASFDGYQKIYPGNLLQCLFDIDVTPRCVGLIKNKGLTSPAYSQFELKSKASGPYYEYLLRYIDDEKCILHLSKNLRSSLTEFDFGLIPTILPPLSEQTLIADYLDKKCAEIDKLISVQEKMIEKLTTYKQSVITEAVTKGLDPNVNMKDSGVEWIGEIPEHWELNKIKYYCSDRRYKSDNPNGYIGLENIVSYSAQFIETESEYDCSQSLLCKANDVIFGKLRPYLAKVLLIDKECCCSNEFVVFSEIPVPNYLKYTLLSDYFIKIVDSSTYGTKMPRADVGYIQNMYICVPTLSEQQTIADYLDKKCAEIDRLIDIKKLKIEKLNTYKKSIIFEYVTGKKEVPHA